MPSAPSTCRSGLSVCAANLKRSVFPSLSLEVILLECLWRRSDTLRQSETAAAFIKRYNIPPTTGFVMNSNKVELLFFD